MLCEKSRCLSQKHLDFSHSILPDYTSNPPEIVYIASLRCPPDGAFAIEKTGKALPFKNDVEI